jgi:hypothetical protein
MIAGLPIYHPYHQPGYLPGPTANTPISPDDFKSRPDSDLVKSATAPIAATHTAAQPVSVAAPAPSAPSPNCFARFATNTCAGQTLADESTKLISGLAFLPGLALFAGAAGTAGATSVAAFGGIALAAFGASVWGVSTALSASVRPSNESLATHIAHSAKAGVFGFCLCCVEFYLEGREAYQDIDPAAQHA